MEECSYGDYIKADCELKEIWDNKQKGDIRQILEGKSSKSILKKDWVSFTHILSDTSVESPDKVITVGYNDGDDWVSSLRELQVNKSSRVFNYYIPIELITQRLEQISNELSISEREYIGISGNKFECGNNETTEIFGESQHLVPVDCGRVGWNDVLFSKKEEGGCPQACDYKSIIKGFKLEEYKRLLADFKEEPTDDKEESTDDEGGPRPRPVPRRDSTTAGRRKRREPSSEEMDEYDDGATFKVRPYHVPDKDNIIFKRRMMGLGDGDKHTDKTDFIKDIRTNVAEKFPYLFMIHSRRWISYNISIIARRGDEEMNIRPDYITMPVDVLTSDIDQNIKRILELLGEWFEDREAGSNPELYDYWEEINSESFTGNSDDSDDSDDSYGSNDSI
jgi:hypothetical protein